MDDPTTALTFQLVLIVTFLTIGTSWLGMYLFNFLRQYKFVKQSDDQDAEASLLPEVSNGELDELKQECLQLKEQLRSQSEQLADEYRTATFTELQSLLTQYKSVQQMVEAKPEIPAKNLTAVFAPLDNLIANWGLEPIGQVWSQVPYDPQLHQADSSDITEGELVYVRFIGYRDSHNRILVPAKVSRTLPL